MTSFAVVLCSERTRPHTHVRGTHVGFSDYKLLIHADTSLPSILYIYSFNIFSFFFSFLFLNLQLTAILRIYLPTCRYESQAAEMN
jgi:hypothetical protein